MLRDWTVCLLFGTVGKLCVYMYVCVCVCLSVCLCVCVCVRVCVCTACLSCYQALHVDGRPVFLHVQAGLRPVYVVSTVFYRL